MIAIFNKGQFVGFWGNKITDNFLKITCERMNWKPSELAVICYDEQELRITQLESIEPKLKKNCDIQGLLLFQASSFNEVPKKIAVFPWEVELAKNLFTQEEIEQARMNKLFIDANPTSVSSEWPYPSAVMTSKEKWIIEKQEVFTDYESIQGVVVDVLQKIADEEKVSV